MKRRKSIRLSGYDYSSAGAYFITIRYFAHAKLTDLIRKTSEEVEHEMETLYSVLEFDVLEVHADHIHFILFLKDYSSNKRTALGEYIRKFKAKITFKINKQYKNAFKWQRLYYDRVIRSENELNKFRRYVANNKLVHELRVEEGAINHAPTDKLRTLNRIADNA